jgi:hypothetical protein
VGAHFGPGEVVGTSWEAVVVGCAVGASVAAHPDVVAEVGKLEGHNFAKTFFSCGAKFSNR